MRAQSAYGPLRSYGRVKSRPIKPRQEGLLATLMPRVEIPDPLSHSLDPVMLMPGAVEVWLEIGFGGGEHLAAQAARNPQILLLGAEPFLNGVASALRHVEEGELENIRIHHGDARDLMAALPDASLMRVFILFPDPWPKTRHHKRRLIQPALLDELARVVVKGGYVRFATDWADYADWTLEHFINSPDFTWLAVAADDWRIPPGDHITTRYETKKLGDCAPVFLDFRRQ